MFGVRMKHTRHRDIPRLSGKGRVKVGFPAGQTDGDVLSIAIWNHYGTRTIPERPFLDNAIRDNRSKYMNSMRRSAAAILHGTTSLNKTLSKLGALAQGDIQGEITALREPPNAPSTVAQKGSSNPLIDQGRMRQAVTWKLDK